MSDGPITPDVIREAMKNPDPVLEALSLVLKELAGETVAALASVMSFVGANAGDMPGAFLLQAVLVEADKVFKPISRETWIEIYDGYQEIKGVLEANPGLKAELTGSHDKAIDKLLDGNF